jgi:hypothetical protein
MVMFISCPVLRFEIFFLDLVVMQQGQVKTHCVITFHFERTLNMQAAPLTLRTSKRSPLLSSHSLNREYVRNFHTLQRRMLIPKTYQRQLPN